MAPSAIFYLYSFRSSKLPKLRVPLIPCNIDTMVFDHQNEECASGKLRRWSHSRPWGLQSIYIERKTLLAGVPKWIITEIPISSVRVLNVLCAVKKDQINGKSNKTVNNWYKKEQGRIHGYPSRVWVGRGSDEIDQPSSWAGAVTPILPVNAEKAKCYRPTDRQTDRVGCRVACTRPKSIYSHLDIYRGT